MKTTPTHKAFRNDLIALLRKYSDNLSSEEMLALASHLVGQLLAVQDQRTMTPAMGMNLIAKNIEQGNRESIDELRSAKGGSA